MSICTHRYTQLSCPLHTDHNQNNIYKVINCLRKFFEIHLYLPSGNLLEQPDTQQAQQARKDIVFAQFHSLKNHETI